MLVDCDCQMSFYIKYKVIKYIVCFSVMIHVYIGTRYPNFREYF